MSTGPIREPHFLRAASNASRMLKNIEHLLDVNGRKALQDEHYRNVADLLKLGDYFRQFADRLPERDWRNQISRYYYACYNAQRAIRLGTLGVYSTDSADHKKISELPKDFPHKERYSTRLADLREDRNACDYDHTALPADMIVGIEGTRILAKEFFEDAKDYLESRGIVI